MRVAPVVALLACVGGDALAPSLSTAQTVAVTWSVAGPGSITSGGLYTAPSNASGTALVIARRPDTGRADTVIVRVALPGTARALAAGFWNLPPDQWCAGFTNATTRPFSTGALLSYLQKAKGCNVRLVLVAPRQYLSADGATWGAFSLDSAKAFTDRVAKILTPDTLGKYDPWIVGLNLSDDYNSAEKWGGTPVTPSQIQAWAAYIRQKMPGLRLGVRVTPEWVTPSLASVIDYAWAQYHTGRGDARTFFDKHAATARALGLALAMGVNVEDCAGPSTAPCTPDQVRTYLGLAAGYPENCALLGWTYSATTLGQPGMRDAWDDVLALAAGHPDVPCRHV